eukprot:UN25415
MFKRRSVQNSDPIGTCGGLFQKVHCAFQITMKCINFIQNCNLIPCCPEITHPLLVDDIFFKIHERTIIFLWKAVKCFCGGVRKPSRTVPAGSGHLRPIFIFFPFQK